MGVELEQVENQEPGSNEEPEDTGFSHAHPEEEYEEGSCEECLKAGRTWQPEAQACTDNCDINDANCFKRTCPISDCQDYSDCKEGAVCVRRSCIECIDTSGWTDGHSKSCDDYKRYGFCENGVAHNIGSKYNYPEANCGHCGKCKLDVIPKNPSIKKPMEKYYRKQDYGGGYRTRRKNHPKRGYRQWDTTTTSTTTTPPPPVHCEMGEWEEWSKFKCSNREDNCGYCKRKRSKQVVKECENGGDCSCKEEQGIDRKRKPCPVDCEMGDWTRWTKCYCPEGKKCVPHDSTETCKKRRKRPVAKQGANGGNNDCEREYDNKDCTTKCAPPAKPGWPTTTTRWPGGGHRRMLATPPPQYKK